MNIHPSLTEQFPFDGNSFKTKSSFNLHYLDEGEGSGAPTVFLHGNPTWSFFYRRLILALREHGRCIVPDHIGCGLSDKPAYPEFQYNLEAHGQNVIDLLDHLKIDRVRLVVHDWGGAIGLSAFRNQPERIEKIVLMNTAAFPSRDVPLRILLCRLPVLGSLFVRGLNGFAAPATVMAVKRPLSRQIKRGFLYPYQNWKSRVAVWRFVKDIPYEKNHSTLPLLEETADSLDSYSKTPILACWGMKDFCFHPGFLKEWEKRLPHIESHKFTNSGHYLLEDDFEGCRSKIEPFLFG
ncbi:MAG: alpha/beta fold hydrolase [Opitutales bacterium]|nr:alpha/beta fold hydrolase [Opitutales bacterium]